MDVSDLAGWVSASPGIDAEPTRRLLRAAGLRDLTTAASAGASLGVGSRAGRAASHLHHEPGLMVAMVGDLANGRQLAEALGMADDGRQSAAALLGAAYRRWGTAAFGRCRGSFSAILWDASTGAMLLISDRAGAFPLYWTNVAGQVMVSTRISAFRACKEFAPRADAERLAQWLGGLLPDAETILPGVKRVAAGAVARLQADRPPLVVPAAPLGDPPPSRYRYAVDAMEDRLRDAVRLRAVPDSQTSGIWLDGTLQALVLAALAVREGAADGPLLWNPDAAGAGDARVVRTVQRDLGVGLDEVTRRVEPDELEWAIREMPEPSANPAVFRLLPVLAACSNRIGDVWAAAGWTGLGGRRGDAGCGVCELVTPGAQAGHRASLPPRSVPAPVARPERVVGILTALGVSRGIRVIAPWGDPRVSVWADGLPSAWRRRRLGRPDLLQAVAARVMTPAAARMSQGERPWALTPRWRAWIGDLLAGRAMRERGLWRMGEFWSYYQHLAQADGQPLRPGFLDSLIAERWLQHVLSAPDGTQEGQVTGADAGRGL